MMVGKRVLSQFWRLSAASLCRQGSRKYYLTSQQSADQNTCEWQGSKCVQFCYSFWERRTRFRQTILVCLTKPTDKNQRRCFSASSALSRSRYPAYVRWELVGSSNYRHPAVNKALDQTLHWIFSFRNSFLGSLKSVVFSSLSSTRCFLRFFTFARFHFDAAARHLSQLPIGRYLRPLSCH